MRGSAVNPLRTEDSGSISGLRIRPQSHHSSRRMLKAASFKKKEQHPLLSNFMSIRVVLIVVTILTVLAMGIGMIVISVNTQHDMVNDLTAKIQNNVAIMIEDQMDAVFNYVKDEHYAARLFFRVPNLTVVPIGVNPFRAYPEISDYLWSIVRKRSTGIEIEFDFARAGCFGFESFNGVADMFWDDIDATVNTTIVEYDWPIDLNQTVASVDLSLNNTNYIYEYEDSAYPSSRIGIWYSCEDPIIWRNLTIMFLNDEQKYFVYSFGPLCNAEGLYLGNLAISITIESILKTLNTITTEIASGKIFIMDAAQRLVATSTNSDIYAPIGPKGKLQQTSIFNTTERWITDIKDKLDGNYGEQRKSVKINGTNYYLDVKKYDKLTNVDWYVVTLFDEKQFLGNTAAFFLKSVLTAAAVTVGALAVVIMVTWGTTSALFVLAGDLQKMSQLDMNVSDMATPRLLEVKRLYKSVATLYVALQSFKKFVPVQVISNIIQSEKAASAELKPARLTIMFQDIEGFTSLSETMDPVHLAKLTSEYMECMTEILCKHGGTIDKYIGDCIMTLFNAPTEVKGHEEKAAKAAVECMQTLAQRNVEWKQRYGCVINIRIGINTGDVLVGNMGGENRMNYTAFGDNVNVAARLEGVNKHFGTRVICSKSVYSSFKNKGMLVTRKLAKVRVSGKSLPTAIYEVCHNVTGSTVEMFGHYKSALKAFKAKDFNTANAKILEARAINPKDKACIQLENRIQEMSKEIVPVDWSYVEDLSKY